LALYELFTYLLIYLISWLKLIGFVQRLVNAISQFTPMMWLNSTIVRSFTMAVPWLRAFMVP